MLTSARRGRRPGGKDRGSPEARRAAALEGRGFPGGLAKGGDLGARGWQVGGFWGFPVAGASAGRGKAPARSGGAKMIRYNYQSLVLCRAGAGCLGPGQAANTRTPRSTRVHRGAGLMQGACTHALYACSLGAQASINFETCIQRSNAAAGSGAGCLPHALWRWTGPPPPAPPPPNPPPPPPPPRPRPRPTESKNQLPT